MGVAWSLAKVGYCGIGLQHEASSARPGDPQVAKRYKITGLKACARLPTQATHTRSPTRPEADARPNLERVHNRPGRDGPRTRRRSVSRAAAAPKPTRVCDRPDASWGRTRPLECTACTGTAPQACQPRTQSTASRRTPRVRKARCTTPEPIVSMPLRAPPEVRNVSPACFSQDMTYQSRWGLKL